MFVAFLVKTIDVFPQSIPQNILESHQLQTITLDYRRECNYNDVVESFASLERESSGDNARSNARDSADLVFLHIVKLAGCHIEINRARTVWRKKATGKSSSRVHVTAHALISTQICNE